MVLRRYLAFLFVPLFVSGIAANNSVDAADPFFIPAAFLENRGQVLDQYGTPNNEVVYLFSSGHFNLQIRRSGFSFELFEYKTSMASFSESAITADEMDSAYAVPLSSARVDVHLINANPDPVIMAEDMIGRFNFYINTLPSPGFENIPAVRKVTLCDVYPGIDLVFCVQADEKQSLKYEFIVHPGADASRIRMQYEGSGPFYKDKIDHWLSLTPVGIIEESPWHCYLLESNQIVYPAIEYENNRVRFRTPIYREETLVLDPQILWGTYFGGSGYEEINAETTIDGNGNVLLTGTTYSSFNIASNGAYQSTYGGNGDVFLAKFESDGTFLWATYLGGDGKDEGYSIAVDNDANIFIAGQTASTSGIATANAFQQNLKGASDVVLAKFSPSGTVMWSTYFGGNKDEFARGVCADGNGDVYITGQSKSANNFATAGTHQHVYGGKGDCYLSKFSGAGTKLWCTYLGGGKSDRAHGVMVYDSVAYIIGTTESPTGIATPGAHQTQLGGFEDLLLAKFNALSGNIYWSTYYGGKLSDHGRSVRSDDEGNVYVTGFTNSFQDIATEGSFQTELAYPVESPGFDGLLARFTSDGQQSWGTYYGDIRNDVFYAIELSDSFIYAAGLSTSTENVTSEGSYQDSLELGDQAGLLVKMDHSGHRKWATYVGAGGDANIQDIALSDGGLLYLAMYAEDDYLVSSEAHQTLYNGNHDYIIYKFYGEENCMDQFEPNNKKADAKLLEPIHVSDNFLPVLASVLSPTDVEWFYIAVTAGEPNIAAILSSLSQDYNIELRNAEGNLLYKTEGGGLNPDTLIANNLPGGNYLIKITHAAFFDPMDCYQVTVYSSAIPFEERQYDPVASFPGEGQMISSPNPASTSIKVIVKQIPDISGEIRLSSLSGKSWYNKEVMVSDGEIAEEIDLAGIEPGVYIVQWLQEGISIRNKIVVMPY